MKKFTLIITFIPFLLLLATHRGEPLYIPRHNPSSASIHSKLQEDGCANIHNKFKNAGTKEGLLFPFSDLKACYESFAFDNERRIDTIDTMKKIFNGFYVFTDQAKEQPSQGYNYEAMDIISEFDKLSQKEYATDFEFTMDATNLVTKLKDPHTLFFPICYTRFIFTQKILLYAKLEDETHKIKVFKDSAETENDDCEVEQIDGVAAIDVITEFASDKVFVSKDLGVRLNMALPALSLQQGTYQLHPRSALYNLPAINNLDDLNKFTDANSYWESLCANPSSSQSKSSKKPKQNTKSKKSKQQKHNPKKPKVNPFPFNALYDADPFAVNSEVLKELSPSVDVGKPVFETINAQFYMLENDVGVAVLASNDIGPEISDITIANSFRDLQTGFKTLADNGAKKLVLDMSNNEGGLIVIAHFINLLLFPDASPSSPSNFRLTDIVKKAIEKAGDNNNSIFNFNGYLTVDEQNFNSASEFLESKFIENDIGPIRQFLSDQEPLPWKSSDMIILTNGFCGSSCSSTSLLFSELHKVQTVAVGGFPNTPLSFSSFAGGQVYLLDDPLKRGFDLQNDINSLGLVDDPEFAKDLSTNVMVTFSIRRAFSVVNNEEVLEYAFKPSTHHIFFDENSIRDPSKLWSQASSLINS
ncbi:15026_t:CDS:2 [Funneliformis caledonium]|uniref:15026_t:CDS:1 n=1 Tax=Funneliformis caledonium TaxID=1117310 RepID=A0A9N9E3I1_9GLOM|nr:15026_t:CDS:2 [Funneliformis caledonium]